ncbi:MAG: ThiF family adenylyltransferase [Acidobacteria bacterium]|nr:ThiF family adenylyltransferase [Acidobacteriota bacterium]
MEAFPAAFDSDGEHARRLRQGRALLVGVGGLGSPAALGLAAAGIGSIVLVDFDRVDESNLQRQLIFDTADVGRLKVEAARAHLRRRAPGVDIDIVNEPLSPANAARLMASVDVVIDGADNFATRYLVNDACVMAGRPNVFGSVSRFDGQVAVFAAPGGPCYRCLHPEPPPDGLIPNCAEGGVLGVLPGVVGALQAVEAVKLLTGLGEPLIGRLLIYDALRMRARDIVLPRDPACPVCGDIPTIHELASSGIVCDSAGRAPEISPATLADWRRLDRRHLLVDVREPAEHAVVAIDGSVLIPLGQIADARERLLVDAPVVVYCRSGARSARAAATLRSFGLDARSLAGGIEAWLVSGPTGATGDGNLKSRSVSSSG